MPELVEYIRGQRAAGVDHGTIVRTLLSGGHSVANINAAFNMIEGRTVPPHEVQGPALPAAPLTTASQAAFPPEPVASATPSPDSPPAQLAAAAPLPTDAPATAPAPRARSTHHLSLALALVALVIGLAGGTAYAYLNNIGPFAHPSYRQGTFLTGLLQSAASISSATYKVTASLTEGPRDADAAPYISANAPDAPLVASYKNDTTRIRDVERLLLELASIKRQKGAYPATLSSVSAHGVPMSDPAGHPYVYTRIDNGSDFALTAPFETPAALTAVRSAYGYAATSTMITGQSVTFTKSSPQFFIMPSAPPKPFFEQMADLARELPAQMQADISLGGTTDFTRASADWKFNVAGNGSFGDLTYAVDIDLLKKGALYYFRLNKFPSLFLSGLNLDKGQWVVVDPAASSTGSVLGLGGALPGEAASYKKMRQEVASFLYGVAQIADRDRLVEFKNAPVAETIDGRHLYRYDIHFAKDALAPFGKDVLAELRSGKYPDLASYVGAAGPETPQSANLDAEYAYYDANTTFSVWVDEAGHPAIVSYGVRIVPPDDATKLAGKQVNLSTTLSLSDINVPVSIASPGGALPLDAVFPKKSATGL